MEERCPHMEVFLDIVQADILKLDAKCNNYPNLSPQERQDLNKFASDPNYLIKSADKVYLQDRKIYKPVQLESRFVTDLVAQSNKFFRGLYYKELIPSKVKEYMLFPVKNAAVLARMYLSPKIHKHTSNVPGRIVIFKCGVATEKVSEKLPSSTHYESWGNIHLGQHGLS